MRAGWYSNQACFAATFAGLGGPGRAVEDLQRLPPLPGEFVVVPHRDERPAGARVLQIRVVQIGAVDRPVIVDGRRDMEVLDLLTVRIPDDVAQASVVHALGAIFGIPDDLVDKVAQVQHEAQPVRLRGARPRRSSAGRRSGRRRWRSDN